MTAGAFDAVVDAYDRYRTGYAPEVYAALASFGVPAGGRLLDVACGTGLATRELVARGYDVDAVDTSEPMIERARANVPAARLRRAAAEALPFAAATFDAVTCAQAFHWFDRARALAEFVRVVRPGGSVAIWWKSLLRGDGTRVLREGIARELGADIRTGTEPTPFEEFDAGAFASCSMRVIPTIVRTTVAQFVGYERSRAGIRRDLGAKRDEYLARLAAGLGTPESALTLSYVHVLYLGRTAARPSRA